jgi:hypothetical protein
VARESQPRRNGPRPIHLAGGRIPAGIRRTGIDVQVDAEINRVFPSWRLYSHRNDSSERAIPEVYSMTATRDAPWTIRNPVGRVRDLPLRRQSVAAHAARNVGLRLAPTCVLTRHTVRPRRFDTAWTAL